MPSSVIQKNSGILIEQWLRPWTNTWLEIMPLMELTQAPVIMDIGGAGGDSLLSVQKLKLAERSYLVEPAFARNLTELQRQCGLSRLHYTRNNVNILAQSGYASKIPYNQADIVIKTYNPFVSWEHVLNQATNARWMISDIYWFEREKFPKVKPVAWFNLDQGNRALNLRTNAYVLARIK